MHPQHQRQYAGDWGVGEGVGWGFHSWAGRDGLEQVITSRLQHGDPWRVYTPTLENNLSEKQVELINLNQLEHCGVQSKGLLNECAYLGTAHGTSPSISY